jgi:hypothetical protein
VAIGVMCPRRLNGQFFPVVTCSPNHESVLGLFFPDVYASAGRIEAVGKDQNQTLHFEPGEPKLAIREARLNRLFLPQVYSWIEGPTP